MNGKGKKLGLISIVSALGGSILAAGLAALFDDIYGTIPLFHLCAVSYVFQIVALTTGAIGIHTLLGKAGLVISIMLILITTYWVIIGIALCKAGR